MKKKLSCIVFSFYALLTLFAPVAAMQDPRPDDLKQAQQELYRLKRSMRSSSSSLYGFENMANKAQNLKDRAYQKEAILELDDPFRENWKSIRKESERIENVALKGSEEMRPYSRHQYPPAKDLDILD